VYVFIMRRSYKSTLVELYSINIGLGSSVKQGLSNISELDKLLGRPSSKFKAVHVVS